MAVEKGSYNHAEIVDNIVQSLANPKRNAKERRYYQHIQELNQRKFPLTDLAIDHEDSGFDEMELFDRAESILNRFGSQKTIPSVMMGPLYSPEYQIDESPPVKITSTTYPDEKLKVMIKEWQSSEKRFNDTFMFQLFRYVPYMTLIPEEDIERNKNGLITKYFVPKTDQKNPRNTIRQEVGVAGEYDEADELQFFNPILNIRLKYNERPVKVFYQDGSEAFQYLKQEEVDSMKQIMDIMKFTLSSRQE